MSKSPETHSRFPFKHASAVLATYILCQTCQDPPGAGTACDGVSCVIALVCWLPFSSSALMSGGARTLRCLRTGRFDRRCEIDRDRPLTVLIKRRLLLLCRDCTQAVHSLLGSSQGIWVGRKDSQELGLVYTWRAGWCLPL